MTVGDICNRNVATVSPGTMIVDAAKQMRMAHVGDLVVIENRNGQHVPIAWPIRFANPAGVASSHAVTSHRDIEKGGRAVKTRETRFHVGALDTLSTKAATQLTDKGTLPTRRPPSLRAVPSHKASSTRPVDLLSEPQRQQLARLATIQQFPARTVVYHAGDPADAVFIISEGAVKSFRDLPSGRRRIAAFLFPDDLFGLAEAGHYVNTVQAMAALTVYRLELSVLTDAFERDSGLEFTFLCKTIHTLREAQHHTIIVARRDAPGRLAMLLRLLERQYLHSGLQPDVPILMSRSDIAAYLGLSLEAVVRASRRLELHGVVEFIGRHRFRVRNRQQFERLAAAV